MADYIIQDTTLTGIAEAIRSKTGGTDPIKVSDMAAQIAGIMTGGGDKTPVMKSGSFKPTTGVVTVQHNLGVIPDIAIVIIQATVGNSKFIGSVGYSQAMVDALGGGYICPAYYTAATGTGGANISTDIGIEQSNSRGNTYGNIRAATETTFVVGGDEMGCQTNVTYRYIVIGGLI